MAKIRQEIPEGIKRELTITLAKELSNYIDFVASYDRERDCKVVTARIRLPSVLVVTQQFASEMYENFPD